MDAVRWTVFKYMYAARDILMFNVMKDIQTNMKSTYMLLFIVELQERISGLEDSISKMYSDESMTKVSMAWKKQISYSRNRLNHNPLQNQKLVLKSTTRPKTQDYNKLCPFFEILIYL